MFSYSLYIGNNGMTIRNKWLSLLLMYVSLGFIWFFYSSFITANGKVFWNFWNFRPTINVICGILLIKILYEYTTSLKDWINIGKVIAWLGGSFAVYAIFQYLGIDQIFNKGVKFLYTNGIVNPQERMVTFFGNGFITSAFLAVCAPMCLVFKGLRYKVIYGLIFIALILLNKTMALLAFGAGLSVYFLMNKSWWKLLFLILLGTGGGIFYFFKNPLFFSLSGRQPLWNEIWQEFLKQPFLGYGLGYFEMFKFQSGSIKAHNLLNVNFAHNEFLQNLIDVGLVGIAIGIAFIGGIFRKIFYSQHHILLIGYTAGFVSFLVLCFGSFPLRIAPIALIAIIYIAGLLSQCKGEYHV
jgi:hypothetical protein